MMRPCTAMVLAAGRGSRMRPLTDHIPKALLPLGGKTLLDHALDRLADAGVKLVVVNAHWRGERLAAHLASRAATGRGPETVVRLEPELLETGGGVKAALAILGRDPFYVVNGDAFWLDGPRSALDRLAHRFASGAADDVLLVHRTSQVRAETGRGDFALDPWGGVRRRREREVVPYTYAGVHLMTPNLLDDAPGGSFSMNLIWDRVIAAGRLRAVVHDGLWFHLSVPADLAEAETQLHERWASARP
jgi:N-acetyl-alpha-D-muramate 1-phosphate uridylyltransferase